MTELQRRRDAYKRARQNAARSRRRFLAELAKQRADRTLESIGHELGIGRSRVHRLLQSGGREDTLADRGREDPSGL